MKKLLYILLFVPFTFLGQNTSYVEQDIPLFLPEGWSMFGYSCFESKDIVEAFEPVIDNVVIVKDYIGNAYLPEWNFNGIGNLEYNRGYQIKTIEEITDFQFCPAIVPLIPLYQVGDLAEGGIVFYVDETGEHGLVAAMEDLIEGATIDVYGNANYQWGCYGEYVNGADGISIGTGYQNTLDIVNQGCATLYGGVTAAQAALDYESEGYSDWYLPSFDELVEMYNTIGNVGPEGNIGGFVKDGWPYWSSSEGNINDAWLVSFDDCSTGYTLKNDAYRVRVIRAFGYTQGCMDETACNFNPEANISDGSCEYTEEGYDCDGNITAEIGDIMEGGYLFYIDETGEHGLVAALEDLTDGATDPNGWGFNGYEWGCYDESVDGADGTPIGTGYQNTMAIVNQGCATLSGGVTGAQAALDYESEGYSDWYLPSKDELVEMYNTIGNGGPEGNIGSFESSDPYYMSSSELIFEIAWFINLSNGDLIPNYKGYPAKVRVIRAF